jgi:hypothetical protein
LRVHWRINCYLSSVEAYPVRLVLAGPYLEETATLASADIFEYLFEFDTAEHVSFDADLVADSFTGTFNADMVKDVANVAFGSDLGLDAHAPNYSAADLDSEDVVYFDPFQNEFTYYVGDINSGVVSFAICPESAGSVQEEFPFAIREVHDGVLTCGDVIPSPSKSRFGSVLSFVGVAVAALISIPSRLSKRIYNFCEVLCGQGC